MRRAQDGPHHLHDTIVPLVGRRAVLASGVPKRATCHTFRDSFVPLLVVDSRDICTVQELLGHKDIATTMIYTYALYRRAPGVTFSDVEIDAFPPKELERGYQQNLADGASRRR